MAPSRMKLRVRRQDNRLLENAQLQSDEEEEQERHERRNKTTRSRARRKTPAVNNKKRSRNTNNSATVDSNNTSTSDHKVTPSPLPSSSSSATSRQVVSAEDASPDSKCPICLDRFNNLAYLDRCLHRFCFMCIQEWSHNKAECPLCKQPFASILHSVRGENDFKKYTLRRSPENGSVAATVAMVAAMASDHRMRLTLRRSGSNRQRRNQRMVPVWEWLVDSPPDSPEFVPISPVETQPFDLAERGIIFEGLTGLGSAGNLPPFVANNRETRKLLYRLSARRRLQREGGRLRALRDREMIGLRRGLYRCGIRVRGVAGGSQDQPQREISVESFCHNPSNLNRLRPWIRRELAVLYGSHDSLITIVQRIIMARIARHGLEDLPVVEDELRPFLLARTDHFLHELVSYARSPLTMENYDLQAVYEPPDVAFNVDALDSSTDSSAVIAISEEEEDRERAECIEPGQEIQTSLSMTGWDDETPGPSYSTADSSCYLSSFSPAPHDSTNQERREKVLPRPPVSPRGQQEVEEECLIVGYKKPIAERTPELVQLSSDSEEDKKEGGAEEREEKSTEDKCKEEEKEKEKATENPSDTLCLALTPSPQCREEIVEDAQPSRSHSDFSNPGQSLTEALLRVLSKDHEKPKRKRHERRRQKRIRSGSNQNSSALSTPTGHCSRSPSHASSFDSDFRGYSLISPLYSSCPSTPKSTSSSCFGSSVSVTPPTPREKLQEVEEEESAPVAEKPGGKRKYKSRHLDSHAGDPAWKQSSGKARSSRSKAKEMERIRKEEREKRRRRKRRERRRREREESRGREDRSPSVEIVYEGTISCSAQKRKRRRQRNTLLSSSPVVITLDSDSDRGPLLDQSSTACSSPFGSQQTVDFCHFPPLPLVHSSAVGGTLAGRDIGELPADILDRGSEKSDIEPLRNKASELISLENSSDTMDSSDINMDLNVVKVEMRKNSNSGLGKMKEKRNKSKQLAENAMSSKSRSVFPGESNVPHKSSTDDADKKLLDSILSVLDGIATKSDVPSTSNHSLAQGNHFKKVFPEKAENQSFPLSLFPTLPPFQQLTDPRTKFPLNTFSSSENAQIFDPKEPANVFSHSKKPRIDRNIPENSHVFDSNVPVNVFSVVEKSRNDINIPDIATNSLEKPWRLNSNRTETDDKLLTMHNLDTHEIASSLLALRDPENTLTSCNSNQNQTYCESSPSLGHRAPSEMSASKATPSVDPLLATLNEKTLTDLVHEKVCSNSRADLELRNYSSNNTEDVK